MLFKIVLTMHCVEYENFFMRIAVFTCHQNENTLTCTLVYSVIERVKEGNFSINLLLWSLQTTPYIQFVIGPVINNCCRKYFQ